MIKLRGIVHDVKGYFTNKTSLLIANDWQTEHEDDIKLEYRKLKGLEIPLDDLVDEVISSGAHSVVLGVLDWTLQLDELLSLLKEFGQRDFQIMIQIPVPINTFYKQVGIFVARSPEWGASQLKEFDLKADDNVFEAIGALSIDTLINRKHWILADFYEPKMYVIGGENETDSIKN
jgi:hypothetical protein